MSEKYKITIEAHRNKNPGINIFDISVVNKKDNMIIFDFDKFNHEGYFTRLLNNLKDNDKIFYVLFYRYIHTTEQKSIDINEILLLSSEHIPIEQTPIKKVFLIEKSGVEAHCLLIKDTLLLNIQKIVDYISSSVNSFCYVIFDSESNKDAIFTRTKALYGKNGWGEKEIIPFIEEGIQLSFGCCGPEDEFKIITKRFNSEQIKDKIFNACFPT